MRIKKAEKEDIEKIAEIETNSGYHWAESLKEEIHHAKKLFSSKSEIYFLENKEAIGYFALSLKNKTAKIEFLSVLKKYHGRGFGRLLLNYAIKLSKKKADRIIVEVWAKNFPALGLYNKFGFNVVKVKRGCYPNKDDKLIMEKKLK